MDPAARTPSGCWECRLVQNRRAWVALRDARERDHRECLRFHLESCWEPAAAAAAVVGGGGGGLAAALAAAAPVHHPEKLAPAPAWLLT
jgi:NADPH-dependent 2,4-dienoyl-CoA reductase/sulfur reductase-like enzyme